MAGPSLSTHVLDTEIGKPASGVRVSVFRGDDLIGSGTTDVGGRIEDLASGNLARGAHRIVFDVAPYFRARGGDVFFERVALDVDLVDDGHYHVPLLVSRFSCASYRGS